MPVNKIRRNGSFAPLSANYYKDDAIAAAGEAAELLYVRALAFCADVLSDGFVSEVQLTRFPGVGMRDATKRAKRLVEVGLWERVEGGYRVTSWLRWNRSKDEIKELTSKDRERKTPPSNGSDDEPPPDSDRIPNGNRAEDAPGSERNPNGFQPRARNTHTHTHTELSKNPPGAGAPSPPTGGTRRRKPALPIPDNWRPTDAHHEQAGQLHLDVRYEAGQFRGHALSVDRRQADWDQAFRNWLDKSANDRNRRGGHLAIASGQGPTRIPTTTQRVQAALAFLDPEEP